MYNTRRTVISIPVFIFLCHAAVYSVRSARPAFSADNGFIRILIFETISKYTGTREPSSCIYRLDNAKKGRRFGVKAQCTPQIILLLYSPKLAVYTAAKAVHRYIV